MGILCVASATHKEGYGGALFRHAWRHGACGYRVERRSAPYRSGKACARPGAQDSSLRKIAAPATMAFILPMATSRGRYFMPQSGATMISAAGA
jgi:hypothetical protein